MNYDDRIRLALGGPDRFSGRLSYLVNAMRAFDRATLDGATWEPHDWRDFD